MKNIKAGLGSALLTLFALVGFCAATSNTAQAQYRQYPNDRDGYYRRDRDRDRDRRDRDRDYDRHDRYERNRGYGNNGGYGGYGNANVYRAAQNQGYQDGLNTGASDADRRQSYNPQRSHYYKDAGRNSRQYSQAYRDGFLQGYDSGYRQYSGYGRNGGYRRNNGNMGSILGGIFGHP